MKWLDGVVIRGFRPLRSLALLAVCGVLALCAMFCVYVSASGESLVIVDDAGFEYWLVLATGLALLFMGAVGSPESEEPSAAGAILCSAIALALAVVAGFFFGILYFGATVSSEAAYLTRDGKVHRGDDIYRSRRWAPYILHGWGTPQVIPDIRGRIATLGFSVRYTVSDEWLQKEGDFSGMLTQAMKETFGDIAKEDSRGKRLAFLAEIGMYERGEGNRIHARLCEKLPTPCPFSAVYVSEADTPDMPRGHWSKDYTASEAVADENIEVALSLLRYRLRKDELSAILSFVMAKGTAEHVVHALPYVPDDHPRHDGLVHRALTEELKDQTLVWLGAGDLLKRPKDRARARTRMFEEVAPEVLFGDRREKIRMSADEANAYGESLLARTSSADGRARFFARYHEQILRGLAMRLVDDIESASADSLAALLAADLFEPDVRQAVVRSVAQAKDSAIVRRVFANAYDRHRGRALSKTEMRELIDGFLANAHDPRWFDAITDFAHANALTRSQVNALTKTGLERRFPGVVRIALEPEWSSESEAQEIVAAFLAFADEYDCMKVLRHNRNARRRISEESLSRLKTCAGDQLKYLDRRF